MSDGPNSETTDPAFLPVGRMLQLYRTGALSPVEVVTAILDRIERLNPLLNAYCWVDPEGALAEARLSEERWRRGEPMGPLDGIPFGVKDLLLARGRPTRRGSLAQQPGGDTTSDAPTVARLREGGAVFLGKTTTSEFGWKGTADNPLTGITRNPWDPTKTSGGSSGGAAVAAAAGMGPLQLGTDGGGSVRIPASFCGIFALKATFGRISAWPAGPMMTLSHTGPMTRSADDAARMLDLITKPDARDWYALPAASDDYTAPVPETLEGLTFGLHLGRDGGHLDPEIAECVLGLARTIEALGGRVEEIELPFADAREPFLTHWRMGAHHLVSQIPPELRHLVTPGLLAVAEEGASLDAAAYHRAMAARQVFGEAMQRAVTRFAAVLTPTVPVPAFAAGEEYPAGLGYSSWLEWARYLYPFNFSRQPAATLPAGFTSDGLPIGVQLAGGLYDDARIVGICRSLEAVMRTETAPRIRTA